MTSWIDDLEKQEREKKTDEVRRGEMILNKSKIISGKLPVFWEALQEQINAQCLQLSEKFPNDTKYHCHKEPVSNGFILMNEHPPMRKLHVWLNVDGEFIDVVAEETGDRQGRTQIGIDVLSDYGLSFYYNGKHYTRADDLAGALIKWCLSIK
jgi:hypothetical protein